MTPLTRSTATARAACTALSEPARANSGTEPALERKSLSPGLGIGIIASSSRSGPTVTFGALTLAGAGAVAAPAGVSSITDAGGTNLVLSGGNLVPDTGGGVSSGTVTFDTGATVTVTAVPGAYDYASVAEFQAAGAAYDLDNSASVIFRGRPGTYVIPEADGDWDRTPGTGETVTYTSTDPDDPAIWSWTSTSSFLWRSVRGQHLEDLTIEINYNALAGASGSSGAGFSIEGAANGFVFDRCTIRGDIATNASNKHFMGIIGGSGSFTTTGDGLTIQNCAISGASRVLNLRTGSGPTKLVNNDIFDFQVDGLVFSGLGNLKVVGNRFHDPVNQNSTDTLVTSVDYNAGEGAWEFTVADTSLLGSPTDLVELLYVPETGTPPTTSPSASRLTDTLIVDGTTLRLDAGFTVTDPGSGFAVRLEPAHGDVIQGLGFAGNDTDDVLIALNTLVCARADGGDGDPVYQGIFMEDLPDGYNYLNVRVLNNVVAAKTNHGITVSDGVDIEVGGNTLIVLEPFDSTTLPPIRHIRASSNPSGTGVRFLAADNLTWDVVATDADHPVTDTNNILIEPGGLSAGSEVDYDTVMDGPTFAPTTTAELLASTSLKSGSAADTAYPKVGAVGTGYASFDTADLWLDHPGYNIPTLSGSLSDETDAAASTTYTAGPVGITAIAKVWPEGEAASNHVAVRAFGGSGSPEWRVTSDAGGSTVVTDWTTSATEAQVGHYVWVRDTSDASNATATDVQVYIGGWSDTWTITTASAAPTLSSPTAAATGVTTADLSVTTDGGDGTVYAVVTTSATAPSAAQVKAGQDHTGSAAVEVLSEAVASAGTISFDPGATGLTGATAYHAHFMHEAASTDQSTVATAAFTSGESIVFEDYTTDLSGNWEPAGTSTVTYDATDDEVGVVTGAAWSGVRRTTPDTVVIGETYLIKVTLKNVQTASGIVELDTAAGSTDGGSQYGVGDFRVSAIDGTVATVTQTITATTTVLDVKAAIRGGGAGYEFAIQQFEVVKL